MTWGDTFVSFDTETTGLGNDARIIEIAFVRFEKGEIAETWESFFKPDGVNWDDPGVQKAMEVNRIERSMLDNAPSFQDSFHHVAARLRGVDVWVAHNLEFDLRMLDQEYKHTRGMAFPILPKLALCTKVLAAQIHPNERKNNLDVVAKRWGVEPDGAHRAASDAITCGRILYAMYAKNALPPERPEVEEFYKQANVAWNNKFGGRRR